MISKMNFMRILVALAMALYVSGTECPESVTEVLYPDQLDTLGLTPVPTEAYFLNAFIGPK